VFRSNLIGENFRTIHRAKGTQRDAIFVMADNNDEFDQWFFGSMQDNEISRCGFVAFSRARKILCVCCSSITNEQVQKLNEMQIQLEIIRRQPQQLTLFPS
jgi:DNA helicase-2/ATP-dependent DNA helicase PcrA